MKCRHCGSDVTLPFIDLGAAPPSNAYLTQSQLLEPEVKFPLRVLVCTECWLVQTEDHVAARDLFRSDYAYFSSFSDTWLNHAKQYVAAAAARFGLNQRSFVVEIAANDGYLLQYVKAMGIPCLGVEPTAATAAAARQKGIEIIEEFFGLAPARKLASEYGLADLVIANNVLAHVPDINDFVQGIVALLKPTGVATFEFPHILKLIEGTQFDTIYHEHYSYFSLTAIERIFRQNGLQIFDIEELPTHGGSLRVFAQTIDGEAIPTTSSTEALLKQEQLSGLKSHTLYEGFQQRAEKVRDDFLAFLHKNHRAGLKTTGYGAAAKGNTLLNFAGVGPDLLPYVADRNPAKQGKYLPGSRIPIVDESILKRDQPDRVIVFPWNLCREITEQLAYIRQWNARCVIAVPQMETLP